MLTTINLWSRYYVVLLAQAQTEASVGSGHPAVSLFVYICFLQSYILVNAHSQSVWNTHSYVCAIFHVFAHIHNHLPV